jgi:regulatory protein
MTITRIAEQVKNKDRVSIYIDGKYEVSLTLSQLLDEKLKVGLELAEQDVKRLHKLSDDGKLRMRMIEWLMIRPHSSKELKDYLYRKKLEPEQIDSWVLSMQKVGYQNDTQFARWWVEQRRNKQRSAGYIKQELRTKGVPDDIIQTSLAETETTDQSALKALIEKKRRNIRYQDDKKLIEYLQRQGFRYSDIVEVLAE